MKIRIVVLIILMSVFNTSAFADHSKKHFLSRTQTEPFSDAQYEEAGKEILVEPNQLLLQVRGIVCSFCAYGAQKSLSKLSFLDFAGTKKVVETDVKKHLIKLFLDPTRFVDFKMISQKIKKAGYDLVRTHVSIEGKITKQDGKVILTNMNNRQKFILSGEKVKEFDQEERIAIQGHIKPENISPHLNPMPIVVVDHYSGKNA